MSTSADADGTLAVSNPASIGAAPDGAAIDTHNWPTRGEARYSLFVLTIVVMFTVLDRQVLALLIDPIKADFKISDTQAALLLGAAFSITYGLAGMPIARIADRTNRRNLIAICIAFWSSATMACGIAQNYAALFIARLGIGIGESGYGPATWSIVTDSYPREKVAFATGTLGIGAMMGTGLALFLGGAVLALVAHFPPVDIPLIGHIRPWQWTFIIVGAPGLLWGLMVLTIKEPARRGVVTGKKIVSVPVREVVRWIRDDWRTYIAVLGGTCMKTLLTVGPTTWGATLIHRQFGWELSKVGMIVGTITLVVSPIAMLCGGKLSEYWTKQGRQDANLRIVLIGLVVSVPLLIAAPLMPQAWMVLALHAAASFVGTLGFGPGVAAFQIITPNRIRAQVSSVSQFGTNVIAFALSPLIVALFTDFVFRDEGALRYSMALNAALMGILAILIVWQGMKPYARSYARAVREGF